MNNIFYGMEKISLVDYDGKVTCTLFTKGCNFRCPFCHNSSLALDESVPSIDFNEILEYLEKRKNMLDAVCITGGEPTLIKELPYIIRQIKSIGFKIKLDTNGSNPKMLKELIDNHLIDYVAMDIKNGLSGYAKTINTHPPLDDIIKSIEILKENIIPYEFRTTLVDEFHKEQDIVEISNLIKGASVLYLQHFINSDNCIRKDLHEVSKEKALEYKSFLETFINNVYLRGY